MKISIAQYSKSLYELTVDKSKSEIDGIVNNFMKLLSKKRQAKLLPKIIEKFGELHNRENGIIEAEMIISRKVDTHKVENFIKEKYQAKKVILQEKIDEKIKGGIIIRVGDEILDGSVARQLNDLKSTLTK